MLKDIVVVDNVFDDVESVIALAKRQKFFLRKDHPDGNNSFWIGKRTHELLGKREKVYTEMINEMFTKIIGQTFGDSSSDMSTRFNWQGWAHFHQLTKNEQFDESWIHRDNRSIVFAGVVYLNSNPPANSGTKIYNGDEVITVDNVFNRLVMYRSDKLHAAENGFGSTIKNNRLTLTFFIEKVMIEYATRGQAIS